MPPLHNKYQVPVRLEFEVLQVQNISSQQEYEVTWRQVQVNMLETQGNRVKEPTPQVLLVFGRNNRSNQYGKQEPIILEMNVVNNQEPRGNGNTRCHNKTLGPLTDFAGVDIHLQHNK